MIGITDRFLGSLHLQTELIRVTDRFLGLAKRDFTDRITKIIIGKDGFKLKDISNSSFAISVDVHYDGVPEIMNLLLQKYYLSQRNPQIYLGIHTIRVMCDISHFLSVHNKELHIRNGIYNPACALMASGEFPHCPILTNLTIDTFHIDMSVPSELRKAIQSGKLPCLRRVTLKGCCGHSSYVDWPHEVETSVTGCNELFCIKCKNE